jgi:MazG family protein
MSDHLSSFSNLVATIKELRSENGCPWDKRQTTRSMTKYLRSEFDELINAIENDDLENICEELGDLLFILLMITEINTKDENFTLDQVLCGITDKLIRRHPHVFAGAHISSEEELREQWRRIKAAEKSKK